MNSISLYVERGKDRFPALHVDCAGRLAREGRDAGIQKFVHISGIGAEEASPSAYIRSRGRGEKAVRAEFPGAVLIRPAVMFGSDDAFITTILRLMRRAPIYPMFGNGKTRLQPVHADDVAEAVARVISRTELEPSTFECGGPRVYTYEELLRSIAQGAHLKPILVPIPFATWYSLARIAELLPNPPLARNQVELMHVDTVASTALPGLSDLGIVPQSVEALVRPLVNP